MNAFSKVAAYKIKTKIRSLPLYTNGRQKEIRGMFHNNLKKKKVGITLTKQVKDLYNKSFDVLKKATEKDIEDRRIAHPHGLIVLI